MATQYLKGTELTPAAQRTALASFVHRFTKDHVPGWAKGNMPNGKPYPVQFASDADWLANTVFGATKAGNLDKRDRYCQSYPTWPDGRPDGISGRKIGLDQYRSV